MYGIELFIVHFAAILGVIFPVPSSPAHLPACTSEGTTQVLCHWDAQHQGNGQGRSFDLDHGVVTFTD